MTGWICLKCGASLAGWVAHCPCSPPKVIVTGYSTSITSGCPQCGKATPGKCSLGGCPNVGTTS